VAHGFLVTAALVALLFFLSRRATQSQQNIFNFGRNIRRHYRIARMNYLPNLGNNTRFLLFIHIPARNLRSLSQMFGTAERLLCALIV